MRVEKSLAHLLPAEQPSSLRAATKADELALSAALQARREQALDAQLAQARAQGPGCAAPILSGASATSRHALGLGAASLRDYMVARCDLLAESPPRHRP